MTDQYRRGLDLELSGAGIASAGDSELRTLSNVAWAIRRAFPWIVLFGFIAAVLAYLFTYTSDTKYTSSAKVMMETRVQTETQFTPHVSGLPLSLTSLESELELLRSTDLIESVVDLMELQSDPEFAGEEGGFTLNPITLARQVKNGLVNIISGNGEDGAGDAESEAILLRETTIDNLRKSTQIEQVGDISAVYQIRVTSKSPQKAAEIANSLATEYLSILTTMKRNDLGQSQQWLAIRIGQLREDLNSLSSDLEAHSIEAPFSPEEYATIKAQRIKAEKRSQLVEEELLQLQEQTDTISQLRTSGNIQEAIDLTVRAGLVTRSLDAAANPDEALAALDTAQALIDQRITVMSGQLAVLGENIGTFKEQQTLQVQHDSVTKRIENEILVTEAIYRDFVSQLGRRAEQGEYLDAGAHIIETARVAIDPSEPRRAQVSIAILFAVIFVGLGLTVVRELLQKRLRTTFEFESTTGVKLSAIVPEVQNESPFETFFTEDGKLDPELLHFGKKLLASKDIGLRALRHDGDVPSVPNPAGVFSKNGDGAPDQQVSEGGCLVISGASSLADEGKTSSLLLIGSVCAEAGYRTLIVDCDTAGSAYRDLYEMTPASQEKVGEKPEALANFIVATPQSGLGVLPLIGPDISDEKTRDETEFLCSPAFQALLSSLSDMYDVILLDTPPLLSAVEAAYLSQLSQRVILFTRWNNTPQKSVLQAMRELENAGIRPSALVATRVNMKKVKLYGDPVLG